MNKNNLKSKTITPNHKSFNKYNLNNLNLSLTNSVENSSFIILKDGTIKQKRHKNSYFEEFLDNKRLIIAMETESKIRRVKSNVSDNKKKNLFYKANFNDSKNIKTNKRNSDTNVLKLQRINMYENVFINDNSFIGRNHTDNNKYCNNLNLNFSYNDIIKQVRKNNKKKSIRCNCNKYDNQSNCKYNKKQTKLNKSWNLFERKNMYKDLWKYLNNNRNLKLNNNNKNNKKHKKINNKTYNSYIDTSNKNDIKDNNSYNLNFDKFEITFKSLNKENEINSNIVNAKNDNLINASNIPNIPNNLKIIDNERIQYNSNISKNNE